MRPGSHSSQFNVTLNVSSRVQKYDVERFLVEDRTAKLPYNNRVALKDDSSVIVFEQGKGNSDNNTVYVTLVKSEFPLVVGKYENLKMLFVVPLAGALTSYVIVMYMLGTSIGDHAKNHNGKSRQKVFPLCGWHIDANAHSGTGTSARLLVVIAIVAVCIIGIATYAQAKKELVSGTWYKQLDAIRIVLGCIAGFAVVSFVTLEATCCRATLIDDGNEDDQPQQEFSEAKPLLQTPFGSDSTRAITYTPYPESAPPAYAP